MPAGIRNYAPPPARVDIALEPGETNDRQLVHRISPEDPWRRGTESLARRRRLRRPAASAAGLPDRVERRHSLSRGRVSGRVPAERVRRRRRQQPGPPPHAGAGRRRLPRTASARRGRAGSRRVPRLDRPLVPARGVRQRTGRRALHRGPVSGDPRLLRRHSRIHQTVQGSEPRQRSRPHLPRRPRGLPAVDRRRAWGDSAPRSSSRR